MITYRLAFILFTPVFLIHLCWKSLQIKSLRYFKQRLGYGIKSPIQGSIWFHCASVGEVNTVLPLIHELHLRDAHLQFMVTSNTSTAAGIIYDQNKAYIQHTYLPLDWVNTTRRFIKRSKPAALFIIETELWPNMIDEAKRRQLRTYIINARLSPKTTDTNRWMASVYRHTLRNINHIYARTEEDRSSFIQMGADENKTSTTGNLKYALSNQAISKQDLTKRDYVIAASTHDDEEVQIARCWLKLNREELLVIAPRHPERKDKILEQLQLLTHQIVTRTDNTEITENTKIVILDTIGELVNWFVSASAVIMGGSFVNRGGHNVIEPAQQAKAILFGPHMENFEFESRLLLDNKAAIQVSSFDELASTLTIVLDSKATRAQLETDALNTVKPFEVILSLYADIVLQHIR